MDETYIIANRTDVGNAREANEDSMVTFDSPNGRVIAVCDGMGGQAAGDVASRLACDIITDILSNNKFGSPTEAITRACLAANQGILHRAAQNPELEGMGATCVMVIIKDGLVYYGWVGDSRIYYIANGNITQISRDQSYVQQLVDSGQISAAEAESHPLKNEILNALGLATMTPPELCTTPLQPEPGSVVLLCSDGLSGMVDDATIGSIVSDPELTLQRKADKLVDRANANGGADNITVQLVQFGVAKGAGARKSGCKPKAKGNMLLWVSIAIAALIVCGAVVWVVTSSKSEKKTEQLESVDLRNNKSGVSGSSVKESSPGTKTVIKETTIVEKKEAPKAKGKAKKGESGKDKLDKKTGNKKETKPKGDQSNVDKAKGISGGNDGGGNLSPEQINNMKNGD